MSSPPTARTRVDQLFAPITVTDLAGTYWRKRSLVVPGTAERLRDISFDRETLDMLLADPRTAGVPLTASYLDSGGIHHDVPIRPVQALPLFAAGMSLQLQVHEIHQGIARLMRTLVDGLGLLGTVGANAFLSPAGTGFGLHLDATDALVIQIDGTKTWQFGARAAIRHPRRNVVAADASMMAAFCRDHGLALGELEVPSSEQLLEHSLQPGDMLYLPMGTWHRTIAGKAPSLSITIGLGHNSIRDLVARTVEAKLSEAHALEDIPLSTDLATLRTFLADQLRLVRKLFGDLTEEDLVSSWSSLRDSSAPAMVRTVADSSDSAFSIPHPVHASVDLDSTGEPSQIVLRSGAARRILSLSALPLVRELVQTRQFSAADARRWLRDTDASDVHGILDALVAADLIRRRPSH